MHRDVFPVACSGIRCQFHLISDSQSHFIVWSCEGEGEERKKEKEGGEGEWETCAAGPLSSKGSPSVCELAFTLRRLS